MNRIILAFSFLLMPISALAACASEDFVNSVTGGAECIAIRTTANPTLSTRPILLVWVHGSNSGLATIASTGAFETQSSFFGSSIPDLVSVVLYRPGFTSAADGRTSTGGPGSGQNTSLVGLLPANVDPVANALSRLKQHYNARYLVTMGDSMGGRANLIIIGRNPGVIDASVTSAAMPDNSTASGALCPCDYASSVPATTKVWAVAGSNDTTAPPTNVQNYVSILHSRGVTANYALAQGRDHVSNFLWSAPTATEILDALSAAILSAPAAPQAVAAPTFSATAIGASSNLSLNVTFPVAVRDLWRNGNLYVGANFRGAWYLRNSTGWVAWTGGPLPVYNSSLLHKVTFPALQNTDVSALGGTQIYAGYGLTEADMLTNGKFGLVYTVP